MLQGVRAREKVVYNLLFQAFPEAFDSYPPRHLGSQIVTFNLHVAQLLPQVKNRKFFE